MASRRSRRLPMDVSAPRRARRILHDFLDEVDRPDLASNATLLATELVTNAVCYGRAPIVMAVDYRCGVLHVDVHDAERTAPTLRIPCDAAVLDAEHGRGLWLVDQIAHRWASAPDAEGKRVWFELT